MRDNIVLITDEKFDIARLNGSSIKEMVVIPNLNEEYIKTTAFLASKTNALVTKFHDCDIAEYFGLDVGNIRELIDYSKVCIYLYIEKDPDFPIYKVYGYELRR